MKFEFTENFPQNAPRYPVGYSLGNCDTTSVTLVSSSSADGGGWTSQLGHHHPQGECLPPTHVSSD